MDVKATVRSVLDTTFLYARGSRLLQRNPDPTADGPYKVFVVGSGRSGTHWLGYILESYPDNHVTVEEKPVYPWVEKMAQYPEREAELFPKLAKRYRAEHRAVLPKHYVDKSHPNLWLAEKLTAEFPEARFVAIYRRLEGTVASMLKHAGVRNWVEIWDQNPRPTRFLGVTEAFMPTYKQMSIPARCAVRVVAHYAEINRLQNVLGRKFHVVRYDDIHSAPLVEIDRISAFLGLQRPANAPMPQAESLSKWQNQLSPSDLADIKAVAEMFKAPELLEARQAA